jgi:hypothetical protein
MISPARDEYRFDHSLTTRPALVGIKSFEYRTEKNLVLKGLDLTTLTAGQLIEMCKQGE